MIKKRADYMNSDEKKFSDALKKYYDRPSVKQKPTFKYDRMLLENVARESIYSRDSHGRYRTTDKIVQEMRKSALFVFNANLKRFSDEGKSFYDVCEESPRWVLGILDDPYIGEYVRYKYKVDEQKIREMEQYIEDS